jgi:CheY-like chemotaxis protein
MSEMQSSTGLRTPVVYFIDDSATMREVIKIAFRKENIQVITCADAASALAQFGTTAPDAVITDVIMPDKDGYEVCAFIKQNEALAKTPVILMSGIVNKTVAEKAMSVKADELVRKPFQPVDLIARVKSLLNPKGTVAGNLRGEEGQASDAASRVLGGLFGAPPAAAPPAHGPAPQAFRPQAFHPQAASAAPVARPAAPAAFAPQSGGNFARPAAAPAAPSADVLKLKNEIRRLELLVKKLQAELEAQRQYSAALEADFKVMQES